MCKTSSQLCALLVVALLPAPRGAQLARPCAKLAVEYAWRYQVAVDKGKSFRSVAMKGKPTQLVVWGGDKGTPHAAAAALLFVALRYGHGYDAAFRPQHFDACTANDTQLSVAPVAFSSPCSSTSYGRLLALSNGEALVPLREPMLARTSTNCAHVHSAIPATEAALRSCGLNLTLHEFRKLKLELPPCNFSVRACTGMEQSARVVLATTTVPSFEIDHLYKYICDNNIPLTFLQFENTMCFRQILRDLDKANISFLFLDKDLWMFKPELLSVVLKVEETDQCLSRDFHNITRFVHRLGDGPDMLTYAPQIAGLVKRFCPQLKYLKEILYDEVGESYSIEEAACKWALRNNDTFNSLISNEKHIYKLYCFICDDDELKMEYFEIIKTMKLTAWDNRDFGLNISTLRHINCHNDINMIDKFNEISKQLDRVIGVVAWSSSEGVKRVAHLANDNHVPLILVGPITPDIPTGPYSSALNGRLDDLSYFYRAFLNNCDWTRLAILSEESTYAKAFTNCLFLKDNYNHVERVITSESVTNILESLQADEARIFIVNTNSSLAFEVLQSAVRLGMTPPHYAWIVRDWSPTKDHAAAEWSDMSHFSLSTAWRGTSETESEGAIQGNATLRKLLQDMWPGAAWPAMAAPLADALLLLHNSFTIFHRLYSTNSHSMTQGGYAMSFSQVYDKIRLLGVARELSFRNGAVKTVTVYLEQWHGAARTVLASWDLRKDLHREIQNKTLCGVPVRDRPACFFSGPEKAFIQKCYDIPLYCLLAMLALLPVVFMMARRARLKQLAIRDLNLLARIMESKQLTSIVHGDSLCMHKKIGKGNFGTVYLATLRQSREKAITIAAKELRDESDKEEYLQEAGILQQLDHENVVKFVGICVFNGSLLILMEYALYGDLLHYLESRRHLARDACTTPADEREAEHVSAYALTRLAREAASALQYLANCGLVHRDVRAANCLIDERRTLKLADFGLARKLCDDLEYTSIRRTMLPVLWMAPESLSRGTFSTASDVWALGILCLELVSLGCRPYGKHSPQQVLAYVRLGGQPPLPPDTSPQTVSLVMACCRHKAAERMTANDVVRYLTCETRALRPALLCAPDITPADLPAPHAV